MSVFEMEKQNRPRLEGIKKAEVCIIGAGMAGLNLAFLLHKSGKKVIVVEAETIGHAQSVRSTAKITCLPGFFYHDLIERVGQEEAMKVARMMRKALAKYADVIYHHQIDCDFERLPFVLVSQEMEKIEKEAKAMTDLGFQVKIEKQGKTALKSGSLLILDNQAQFHPGRWMNEISKGIEIFEHSRVTRVESHEVFTEHGKVQADHIVFCDHYPFINFPGFYFTKMHQERSYVIALRNVPRERSMIYCPDDPIESLRFSGKTALYSGFSHPTGKGSDEVIKDMKKRVKERFPEAEVIQQWSAQDCMTLDNLPYIGRFSSMRPFWYVAAGFNKWGMIYSMVSAMILHDQILGIQNLDAEPFDSLRSIVNTPIEEMKQMWTAVKGYVQEFLTLPELKIEDLAEGEGGIVEVDGLSLGVYKDMDGTSYMVSTRCPHLKCQLTWNKAEKTWDCPCHGSRFDRFGNRIEGPAEKNSIFINKVQQKQTD
ncbi:MAG: FAD-dependent oxidoreductase [Erysipelotrichaceae bacterium]|nr:FAD-dependent oxidoreductase [Erysipelotrichaceae bacterium]